MPRLARGGFFAGGGNLVDASANADATFTAADYANVFANHLVVGADAEVFGSGAVYGGSNYVAFNNANADASLYMAAGTHAIFSSTQGADLFVDVDHIGVYAFATGRGDILDNASASASAVFKASRDVDFFGWDLRVGAVAITSDGALFGGASNTDYAAPVSAVANASLYMAAGTHGSSGDLLVNMSGNRVIDVYGFAEGNNLADASADASATFTAADNAGVYAFAINVSGTAEIFGSGAVYGGSNYVAFNNANADASLYMAAGTHAIFSSTGGADLFVQVDQTDVYALALVDGNRELGNASAYNQQLMI